MTLVELPIFKTSHEATLASHVKSNIDRYSRKAPWAVGDALKTCALTGYKVPDNLGEILDPLEDDLDNAIALHQALIHLTPKDASNPMFWCRLSHVELWDYMRHRWDASERDSKKRVSFIKQRYFVIQNNSRTLMRNGLGFLWWTAHLTHDPKTGNYTNTDLLLKMPEIAERSFGRSPTMLRTILRFIAYKEKSIKIGGRDRFRKLLKRFNALGGTSLLDELSEQEIENFLEKEFKRIKIKEKK